MANLVAAFRQEDVVRVNDIYWDVVTGRVFQYQGSSDITSTSTSVTFTELTNDVQGGFISADALLVSSDNDRVEIRSNVIKVFNNSVLRVKIGDLTA
jgi:hypothetical protein